MGWNKIMYAHPISVLQVHLDYDWSPIAYNLNSKNLEHHLGFSVKCDVIIIVSLVLKAHLFKEYY